MGRFIGKKSVGPVQFLRVYEWLTKVGATQTATQASKGAKEKILTQFLNEGQRY